VLTLSTRSRGRSVTNRFAVTGSATKISEIATSRGQRLRWTVGANGIALQGRGFAKRHRLRLRWLGHTVTLRTNARGRFLTTLALPTSGASHPVSLRLGSLRLKFTVLGPFGSSPPVGGSGIPAPPPLTPGVIVEPPTPQAPRNTQPPTIAGAPQVGATLAVDPGTWSATQPVSFAYQWQRCNSSGSSCSAIGGGATGQSYQLTSNDQGKTLRAMVIATNPLGSASATSAPTAVVVAPPANTVLPKITGTAQEGKTLTASKGTWSGTAPITYAYQWQTCNDSAGTGCAAIFGATQPTYAVSNGDVGRFMRVIVTATNSAGSVSAISSSTAAVLAAPVAGFAGLWHMNDTSGGMADSSGNGHTGTLHGSISRSGSAYGFTGSGWVEVPSGGGLNPGDADFTIAIALNTTQHPPATVQDWDLIRKGVYYTEGGEYKVEYAPNGQAICGIKGSNTYWELQGGPDLGNGAWHNVECVKTSGSITLKVDGAPVATKNIALGAIDNAEPVVIASHAGTSEFYQGLLDEASIKIG
jgi:hypothetical protein